FQINTIISIIFHILNALFFFFQAEDGIRDFHVTGVQTCALPISVDHDEADLRQRGLVRSCHPGSIGAGLADLRLPSAESAAQCRSEERRVGKECRTRWSPYH